MGFLKGIANGIGKLAKAEVGGLVKLATQNPITSAKQAVKGYTNIAHKHGWFAWTPPGNMIGGMMDLMKKAAPKPAPTADRPLHGKF